MTFDTLCLSGGGLNGFNIIGSIKYLNNANILKNSKIKNYFGTSVGSLICFLMVINYEIDSIIKILYKLNLNKIDIDYDIDNLIENYGFNNCSEILAIIQTLLYNKLHMFDITFEQLYNFTKKSLNIIVTNFTRKREEILNYKNNPKMSIILALRMSISIPLIFYPVKYNNELYIDGSVINNFGFNHCNSKKTLGICLRKIQQNNPNDIIEYLKGIFIIIQMNLSTKHLENSKHENIIYLNCSFIDDQITIKKDKKLDLLKEGYKQTKKIKRINFIATIFINNLMDKLFIKN